MKNVKGGYKIISLEENDLTSSFSVIGIYTALSKTYDKTILVSGIVIDGEKKNDAYTEVNVDSTDYKFTVYGYEVTVSSDDSVEAEAVTLDAVTSIGGVNGAITLGEGLAITEEGELSATSSNVKLYQHTVMLNGTADIYTFHLSIYLICSRSTAFANYGQLKDVLGTNTSTIASGYMTNGTTKMYVNRISLNAQYQIKVDGVNIDTFESLNYTTGATSSGLLFDSVVELK